MTKTPSTRPATTITTVDAIKKLATAAAIAGALGLAALGVANGTAAAAPADNSGSKTSASSEQHAGPASRTGDSEVHAHLNPGFKPHPTPAAHDSEKPHPTPAADDSKIAHLIPGFTPKPIQTTTAPSLGSTSYNQYDGPPCNDAYCHEVI
jgi:hypothetical protein